MRLCFRLVFITFNAAQVISSHWRDNQKMNTNVHAGCDLNPGQEGGALYVLNNRADLRSSQNNHKISIEILSLTHPNTE